MNKLILSLSEKPGIFGTRIYNRLFRELGMGYFYQTIRVDSQEHLNRIFDLFDVTDELHGMSISMPYKGFAAERFTNRGICAGLDQLEHVNSVNTIAKDVGGRIESYSTDTAFFSTFDTMLARGSRICILGSGSMARLACEYFMHKGHICEIVERRQASSLGSKIKAGVDAFINCTPVLLEELGLDFNSEHRVLDLPVRYSHPWQGQSHIMTGDLCALEQIFWQFKIYTGCEVSRSEFSEVYNELFRKED